MGRSQRQKGARGERLWRDWLRTFMRCEDAKRGQQRSGTEQADVVGGVPGTWSEVKFVEKLNFHAALEQANNDAEVNDGIPYVASKRARESWKITLFAEHLMPLAVAVVRHGLRVGLLSLGDIISEGQPRVMDVWMRRDTLKG
jgi:hypothetical protein